MTNVCFSHIGNARKVQPTSFGDLRFFFFFSRSLFFLFSRRKSVAITCWMHVSKAVPANLGKNKISRVFNVLIPTFFFFFYFLVLSVLFLLLSCSLCIILNSVFASFGCLSMIFFFFFFVVVVVFTSSLFFFFPSSIYSAKFSYRIPMMKMKITFP